MNEFSWHVWLRFWKGAPRDHSLSCIIIMQKPDLIVAILVSKKIGNSFKAVVFMFLLQRHTCDFNISLFVFSSPPQLCTEIIRPQEGRCSSSKTT